MKLRLYDVVIFLKKQGYPIENTFVAYYSNLFSAYINCSLDPISRQIYLSEEDFEVFDG